MNKIVYIIFLSLFFSDCSHAKPEDDLQQNKKYKEVCISNPKDGDSSCIPCSNNLINDVFEILSRIDLYNVLPNRGKYLGVAEHIIIDTLGGGLVSDTTLANGMSFRMYDFYYYKYEYNDQGFIKSYTYIDEVKSEDCISVDYVYEKSKLKSIIALNPHLSTFGNEKPNTIDRVFIPDTLYTIALNYTNDNLLNEIIVGKSKKKVIYNAVYKQRSA